MQQDTNEKRVPFWTSCREGLRFIWKDSALLRMILFFIVVNFFAKLGGDGMMSAFVLSKTGGDQNALSMVQIANSLAFLIGGILVTCMKPAVRKTNVIFISCAITFLVGNTLISLFDSLPFWMVASFISYIFVTLLGANLTAVMRAHVPIRMQGRVFSARDTIQNGSIPLGLLLGGVLADHVFEPFMAASSPVQQVLSFLFGDGKGSGIAVLFFIVGIAGFIISILAYKNPIYQELNENNLVENE